MDGNRRWARSIGLEDVAHGHRSGAEKIVDLLGWCDDAGVEVVTLFLLSTDNLRRPEAEVTALLRIIEDVVVDLAAPGRRWQLRAMGAPEVLPPETVAVLKQAEEDTRDRPGATVNLAVGYGGRREIADAVRSLLAEHAERGTTLDELVEVLDVEHIAEHLYTAASPIPTSSSAPAVSSGCRGSCSGRRRTRSSTSPTSTGRTSVGWTFCGRCATTRPAPPFGGSRRVRTAADRLPGMPAAVDVPLEYVRLGLRFDRLESGFVDAFTGDPRIRAEVGRRAGAHSAAAARPGPGAARASWTPRSCPPTGPTSCAVS